MSGDRVVGGGGDKVRAMAIALSLIRQPSTFKVVRGVLSKKSLSEIARSYGMKYKYVQKVIARLSKEGLVVKVKTLGRVVVLPTPLLKQVYDLALRELYFRSKSEEVNLVRYGLVPEDLERLVKSHEASTQS